MYNVNVGDIVVTNIEGYKKILKVTYVSNNGSIKGYNKEKKLFWDHVRNITKIKKAVEE